MDVFHFYRHFAGAVVHAMAPLLFLAPAASAASVPLYPRYVFEPIADRFDISTSTVTSIAQDGRGFLWMGTQQGLQRYDGGRIIRYGREQGLPTLFIDQLAVAADGKVWVGTNDGIARFNGSRFDRITIPFSGARFDSIYQIIAPDRSGGVYAASSIGLLYINPHDPSKQRLWTRADGLPAEAVEAVFVDADGTVYFICGNHVGVLRDPAQPPEMLQPEIPKEHGEKNVAVLFDADGIIWVRTNYHVLRLDPNTARFTRDDEGIPKANDFGVPVLDRLGQLMVPTVRGLFRRVRGAWECISEKNGMISDAVFSAMEDRDGAIWVGFGGAGAARWPESKKWAAWTKAEGLPDSVVWCELRDRQGRLWAGTDNGLAMWDPRNGRWRIWTEKQGLAGATVRQLKLGSDGTIWAVSIPGGITRVDPVTSRAVKTRMPPEANDPAGIAIAPDGRVWAGNTFYLKKILSTHGELATFEDIPVPPEARGTTAHPEFASDGTLWSSGRKGVSRFDGHNWTVYTTAQGLRANVVSTVLPVSSSEAWIRYVEPLGLGHLKLTSAGVEMKHFTTREGMATNAVFLIGRDNSGRVWAGGNEGVNIIDPAGQIHGLRRADGLIWNDLSSGGFWADPDGSIFLGTSRGLVRFRAGSVDLKVRHPDVFITSASLGGKDQLEARNPVTAYANRTFVAQFAELSFRDPEKTPCRYRMANLESDYTETLQREARYVSLPSGSYRFEVSCRYADGVWSAPATYAFSVAPAWWEQWWARLTGLCLLGSAVLGAVRLRTRALELDRQRLEQAVAARNAELARANHELKEAALTDPLTKARNRRYFQLTIEVDVQKALRANFDHLCGNQPGDLVLYLVDLDNFKQVNDLLGHQSGDLVLTQVAGRLHQIIRGADTLIRWGGEEFLIVCRDARRDEATALAQRILDAVGCEPLELDLGRSLRCTCSVGWAAFPWLRELPETFTVSDVIQVVDRALYMAKHDGRNQCVGLMPDHPNENYEQITVKQETVNVIRTPGPFYANSAVCPTVEDVAREEAVRIALSNS